jgi:hypothetical protein
MSGFVPYEGESEALKSLVKAKAIILGLYKNQVVPSGSLKVADLTEMLTGGYRGYAEVALANDIVETGPAAGKWSLSQDAQGRAQVQYDLTAQIWTFAAADVADAATVYGIFGYTWILPFASGLSAGPINVGDTITGGTSGATGVVTEVIVESGSWAANTAAGYLAIMTKSGTFQNNEAIKVGVTQMATTNTGSNGDALKKLMFIEPLATPQPITQVGQQITYLPKQAQGTA